MLKIKCMISQGQLIFAGVALVAFIILMAFSYSKDKKRNKSYFKNSYVVLIVFVLFLIFLFVMKLIFESK